jgi:hypothetical protein
MSVTSINTSNGSGLTTNVTTGAVVLNSQFTGGNGLTISAGTGKQKTFTLDNPNISTLSFNDPDGQTLTLQTTGTMANPNTYTLPDDYPATDGFILSSTTTGDMSWIANVAGGVTNPMTSDLDGNSYDIKNLNNLSVENLKFNSSNNTKSTITSGTLTSDIIAVLPSNIGTNNQIISSNPTTDVTPTTNLSFIDQSNIKGNTGDIGNQGAVGVQGAVGNQGATGSNIFSNAIVTQNNIQMIQLNSDQPNPSDTQPITISPTLASKTTITIYFSFIVQCTGNTTTNFIFTAGGNGNIIGVAETLPLFTSLSNPNYQGCRGFLQLTQGVHYLSTSTIIGVSFKCGGDASILSPSYAGYVYQSFVSLLGFK